MLISNSWLKYLKSSLLKFLTKLSNEELKNWKLSIKTNLLLMLQLIYFSNLFRMIFILRLNLPSSCIIKGELLFLRLWNTKGIFSCNLSLILRSFLHRASIFFSDLTKNHYFNITINIGIITDPTFSRVLKIFIILLVITSSLLKCFFITSLQCSLSWIIILTKL